MLRRRNKSSRLTRTSEKQNKKQAIFFTLGIVIIIGVLIQFGPFLVNVFGNIVYTLRGGDHADNPVVTGNAILQAPLLEGIPEATQSSRISFNGSSVYKDGVVEIYVNDELEEEIDLAENEFAVDNLPLKKGTNTIKARYSKDNKTSPFSDEFEVSYISDKPKLEVSSPTDNQTFTKADKSITVSGKTDPDNTVSVNSFRAIVEPNGEFSYLLQLNDGENQITIEAKNSAGITEQKQLKVTYNP